MPTSQPASQPAYAKYHRKLVALLTMVQTQRVSLRWLAKEGYLSFEGSSVAFERCHGSFPQSIVVEVPPCHDIPTLQNLESHRASTMDRFVTHLCWASLGLHKTGLSSYICMRCVRIPTSQTSRSRPRGSADRVGWVIVGWLVAVRWRQQRRNRSNN